jgi:WD40 repeat protein
MLKDANRNDAINKFSSLTKYELLYSIPRHIQIGNYENVSKYLSDYEWLQAKFEVSDVEGLIRDYNVLPERSPLRNVSKTLHLASQALSKDKKQLEVQLLIRLSKSKETCIKQMLKQARKSHPCPWLRPVRSGLIEPNNFMIFNILDSETFPKRMVFDLSNNLIYELSDSLYSFSVITGLKKIISREGPFLDIAFGSKTNSLFTVAHDGILRKISLDDPQKVEIVIRGIDRLSSMALTEDELRLICGFQDGAVKIYDLKDREEEWSYLGHSGNINDIAILPNQTKFITASDDQTKIWDYISKKMVLQLSDHAYIRNIAITPDGNYAISASWDKTLKMWKLDNGEIHHILKGHTDFVECVAITQDGHWAYSGGWDQIIRKWDIEHGNLVSHIDGHKDWVFRLALNQNGNLLASISKDNSLKVWNLENETHVTTDIFHTKAVKSCLVNQKGNRGYSVSMDGIIKIWELLRGSCLKTLKAHDYNINRISLSQNETHIISSALDGIKLWKIKSHKLENTIECSRTMSRCFALTIDGTEVICDNGAGAAVYELKTGRKLYSIKMDGPVECIVIDSNSKYVFLGSGNNGGGDSNNYSIHIWDMESKNEYAELQGHKEGIMNLRLAKGGSMLISSSTDGTYKVWDISSKHELYTLSADTRAVGPICLTPNQKNFLAPVDNYDIVTWNLNTAQELKRYRGHTGTINAIVVSDNCKYVVTGSDDMTLKVWDYKTGKILTNFIAEGKITTCALVSNTMTIIAGDSSGKVHILKYEE